jgi:hypothetical protein
MTEFRLKPMRGVGCTGLDCFAYEGNDKSNTGKWSGGHCLETYENVLVEFLVVTKF